MLPDICRGSRRRCITAGGGARAPAGTELSSFTERVKLEVVPAASKYRIQSQFAGRWVSAESGKNQKR